MAVVLGVAIGKEMGGMVSLGANVATLVAAGVGYRSFVLASTSQATTFVSNAARVYIASHRI